MKNSLCITFFLKTEVNPLLHQRLAAKVCEFSKGALRNEIHD